MIKNSSVTVLYRAWDTSAQAHKTGDVANHTIYTVLDGTATVADNSPSEVDATNLPGLYKITLSAAETNGDYVGWGGKSSTANVVLFGGQAATDQGKLSSVSGGTIHQHIFNLTTGTFTVNGQDPLELNWIRGETYPLTYEIQLDRTAVDLTGASIIVKIREYAEDGDGTVQATFTSDSEANGVVISDATNGEITIYRAAQATEIAAMTAGNYKIGFQATLASGKTVNVTGDLALKPSQI